MDGKTIIGLEVSLKVGCPVDCSYCPQATLRAAYKGDRVFTLERFRECLRTVPTWRHLAFTGFSEPFTCPDAVPIMQWAFERGHVCAISTTLTGLTHEKIDAIAGLPWKTTVIHTPCMDGAMRVKVDAAYLELLDHAITAWKHHADFVPSSFRGPKYPEIEAVFAKHGYTLPNFGLHDRCGLIPWLRHIRIPGEIPLCGKMFCGNLLPNGDLCLCCDDYGLQHVFGNLLTEDYPKIYEGERFQKFMADCLDPNSEVICRYCDDNSKQGWDYDHLPKEIKTHKAFGFGVLENEYGFGTK